MEKRTFAVLTDSACDMPVNLEKESGVEILCFGITVDGVGYTERESFTFDEYYDILRKCEGIPTTSQITMPRFLEKFKEYDDAGCQALLYVSICGTGSATHGNAVMAREAFQKERPASGMKIYVVDSHCYSMGYGWYVVEAIKRLEAGEDMREVALWLSDVFTRVEIALAAYSLKFMKKSGRISAAAAFAGELLGLRPVVSLNDGVSVVQKKVRGDKEVHPALMEHVEANREEGPYMVVGTNDADIAELARACEAKWGEAPVGQYKLGGAVATNTGPDAIAIVFMGKARRAPDPVAE